MTGSWLSGTIRAVMERNHPVQPAPAAFAADRVLSVAAAFAVVGALAQGAVGIVNGIVLERRSGLLDPDAEYTVFAWASGVATFAAALAALLMGIIWRTGRVQLLVLAAFIAFYSADDMLVIHEPLTAKVFGGILGLPTGLAGRMSGALYFPLLAATVVLLLLEARRMPIRAARFVVVGLACLAGGVLLELVNGALTAADLISFRDTWDVLIAMTEESIELAGWILVAGALLSVLCGRLVEQGLGVAARGASGGRA